MKQTILFSANSVTLYSLLCSLQSIMSCQRRAYPLAGAHGCATTFAANAASMTCMAAPRVDSFLHPPTMFHEYHQNV